MRLLALLFVVVLLALGSGCARSTIETRKQERYDAYAGLADESKTLVDGGRIKIGMSTDAVYIAWGKPSEILDGQSVHGHITTWLYHGTHFREIRYWSHRAVRYADHAYYEPYLRYDYQPVNYVQAEVNFENGVVKSWQMLPRPGY